MQCQIYAALLWPCRESNLDAAVSRRDNSIMLEKGKGKTTQAPPKKRLRLQGDPLRKEKTTLTR